MEVWPMPAGGSGGDELLASSIRNHLAALDTLTRNVEHETFQTAVAILAGADRVIWRGVGPSTHLAAYGQLITQRIGKSSSALVHSGTSFADELLTLAANDAIVLFAYGRLQSHVRVLLERADGLGAPVVLITDTLGRKLAPDVSATLRCGRGAPGLFASHGTTLVVVETLVLAIAATRQAESQASPRQAQRAPRRTRWTTHRRRHPIGRGVSSGSGVFGRASAHCLGASRDGCRQAPESESRAGHGRILGPNRERRIRAEARGAVVPADL